MKSMKSSSPDFTSSARPLTPTCPRAANIVCSISTVSSLALKIATVRFIVGVPIAMHG
jgi:hypothetical protein